MCVARGIGARPGPHRAILGHPKSPLQPLEVTVVDPDSEAIIEHRATLGVRGRSLYLSLSIAQLVSVTGCTVSRHSHENRTILR